MVAMAVGHGAFHFCTEYRPILQRAKDRDSSVPCFVGSVCMRSGGPEGGEAVYILWLNNRCLAC